MIVATNHAEFREPATLARDRRARRGRLPGRRSLELLRRRAGVRLRPSSRSSPARRAGAGSAAVSRVLVTGGAGTIGAAVVRRLLRDPAYEVRVSDQRARAAVDARGLRGPHRRPARARARRATAIARLLARHPPRGDRRRDRQLPQAAPHAHRGQQRALQRRRARRARRARSSASSTSPPRWSSSAPSEFPTPEDHLPRLPGAALGLRLLEAHRRGLLPRRARRARAAATRSAAPSTPTGPARCPTPSRASPTPSRT